MLKDNMWASLFDYVTLQHLNTNPCDNDHNPF
jgi:hypothetical protein